MTSIGMVVTVRVDGKTLLAHNLETLFGDLFNSGMISDRGMLYGTYLRPGTKVISRDQKTYVINDISVQPLDKLSYINCKIIFDLVSEEKITYENTKMPYLELFDSAGKKIDPSKFGAVFKDGVIIPGIGSTVIDTEGKKWSVRDIVASTTCKDNNTKKALWSLTLNQKDIDI